MPSQISISNRTIHNMPPKRTPSRTHKSTTAERILNNLPPEYASKIPREVHVRNAIITKTNEIVRIVKSKLLGGNTAICMRGDTPDGRYAAAMEIVLRRGIDIDICGDGDGDSDGEKLKKFSIRIPIEVLGKSVGKKKDDVKRINHAMDRMLSSSTTTSKQIQQSGDNSSGNIETETTRTHKRQGLRHSRGAKLARKMGQGNAAALTTSTSTSTSKSTPPTKKHNAVKNTISKRSTSSRTSSSSLSLSSSQKIQGRVTNTQQKLSMTLKSIQPTHLHDISIHLQSKLHDPEACESAASTLFHTLVKYSYDKEKTNVTKKAVLDDVIMNCTLYDGCCFFIAAKEMEYGPLMMMTNTTSTTMADEKKKKGNVSKLKRSLVNLYTNGNGNDNGNSNANGNSKGKGNGNHENVGEEMELDHNIVSSSLLIEDVADVLRVELSQLTELLGDVLYGIQQMRLNRRRVSSSSLSSLSNKAHVRSQSRPRSRSQSPPHKRQRSQGTTGRWIMDNIHMEAEEDIMDVDNREVINPDDIPPQCREPKGCKAMYRDKEFYIRWKEETLRRLTASDESVEIGVKRLYKEMVHKYTR